LGDPNVLKKLLSIALLFAPALAYSQVAPATRGGGLNVWTGVEYSNFKPDFGGNRLGGITVVGDINDVFLKKLSLEGEARWLHFNQYFGETEANYLGGVRYRVWRYHGLDVYPKFLIGGGLITFPNKAGNGSYFAYAPGGTVEYHLARRWLARADYEYQIWPSAPGTQITYPNPSNGLTPNGFSVGVSYRVF
jgi:opacity protein-like surface antigen